VHKKRLKSFLSVPVMFAPARGRFFVRASAPAPSADILRYMARRVTNRHRRVSRNIFKRAVRTLQARRRVYGGGARNYMC